MLSIVEDLHKIVIDHLFSTGRDMENGLLRNL